MAGSEDDIGPIIEIPDDTAELEFRALALAEQVAESPFLGAQARSELVAICRLLATHEISYQKVLEITALTRRMSSLLDSKPKDSLLAPVYDDRAVIWEHLQLLVKNQEVPGEPATPSGRGSR